MPAVSKAQAVTARIATHDPGTLYARNKGMASMSLYDLSKLAGTPTRGLPRHTKKKTRR